VYVGVAERLTHRHDVRPRPEQIVREGVPHVVESYLTKPGAAQRCMEAGTQ
jgi:hypothetical protein